MYFAVSIGELDRSLIAGFLEGEATLVITEQNGGQSLSCAMILKKRDDEQPRPDSAGCGESRRA